MEDDEDNYSFEAWTNPLIGTASRQGTGLAFVANGSIHFTQVML